MRHSSRWRARWCWLRALLSMDSITIDMRGGDKARALFEKAAAPHPKLRVVGKDSLGASLIPLSGWRGSYLQGSAFADARRKARRAEKAGFIVRRMEAAEHQDDILAIHRSSHLRQGKPMWEAILSEGGVASVYGERRGNGVFDPDGCLHGYVFWVDAGDVIVLRGLMGHADSLHYGIMYMLMVETIRSAISASEHGGPAWLQYSMHRNDSEGMRRFKRELGFRPYRVRWRWKAGRPGFSSAQQAVTA